MNGVNLLLLLLLLLRVCLLHCALVFHAGVCVYVCLRVWLEDEGQPPAGLMGVALPAAGHA